MTHGGITITPSEASIIAAAIGAVGWSVAGRWQHRTSQSSERMEAKLDELKDALTAHTADDARNFAELRNQIPSRRRRLVPSLLFSLVRLFL